MSRALGTSSERPQPNNRNGSLEFGHRRVEAIEHEDSSRRQAVSSPLDAGRTPSLAIWRALMHASESHVEKVVDGRRVP